MSHTRQADELRARVRRAVRQAHADAEKRSTAPVPTVPAQSEEPVSGDVSGDSEAEPIIEETPQLEETSDIIPASDIAETTETASSGDNRSVTDWLMRR